ncbi:MAG: alcohol dehydrogenase [Gammaproteobacteria bacterium]|nr:alcohol dehydrogenase [Gammaproteobacteria bacterium]
MRAVAVEKLRGEPRLMEIPQPVPNPDQLLVKVSAAGINPLDWKIADGIFEGAMPNVLPLVLGVDAAGVVAGTGARVSRFKTGDRVFGQFFSVPLGVGTYAEYTVVGETAAIAKLPSTVSDEQGAALPTAAMTALGLVDSLELPPGSKVLIVGATGGVGSFATQLAAAKGFTVLVTAGAQDVERMKKLGAHETFDYRATDLTEQISAAHRQGIDAVIDMVSDASTFKKNTTLLSNGGRALTTLGVADEKEMQKRGVKGGNFTLQADAGMLQRLATR